MCFLNIKKGKRLKPDKDKNAQGYFFTLITTENIFLAVLELLFCSKFKHEAY